MASKGRRRRPGGAAAMLLQAAVKEAAEDGTEAAKASEALPAVGWRSLFNFACCLDASPSAVGPPINAKKEGGAGRDFWLQRKRKLWAEVHA